MLYIEVKVLIRIAGYNCTKISLRILFNFAIYLKVNMLFEFDCFTSGLSSREWRNQYGCRCTSTSTLTLSERSDSLIHRGTGLSMYIS